MKNSDALSKTLIPRILQKQKINFGKDENVQEMEIMYDNGTE